VDIVCQGFAKTINIQVKTKPRKMDIKQLEQLAKSTGDKKIYVYIKQPTKSFKVYMNKLKGNIDFWNSKKLHEFLVSNRSQSYLRYLFLGCKMVRDLCNALIEIFSCSKIDPTPLDSYILNDWWDLKDSTVKLHANLEHLELYWKDEILVIDRHDPALLKSVLEKIFHSLLIVGKTCSKDVQNLIVRISDKRPSTLSCYVGEILKSSSWIGMNRLKDEVDNRAEARSIIHEWIFPSRRYRSEYSLINDYLAHLHYVGIAIEDGVDFIFRAFREE